MTAHRKKLIEVALPLEAINDGSKPETENPFLRGHPRSIHNWWARTPLSICRAILFAQLVDDPGEGLVGSHADKVREPLVDLIRRLGTWDAIADSQTIDNARSIIEQQYGGTPPALWDMFAGRGSICMEAQRLGLRVYSSDLNPVAVTIQKALLQYPQKFGGLPPVNPEAQEKFARGLAWNGKGADGLAEDVRHYGRWMRGEAEKRIGHLYPKARLPDGTEATVFAWLWARTVASPNPAAGGAHVPLVRSFVLSSKKGREAWVEPVFDDSAHGYLFTVRTGSGSPPDGTVRRRGARCLLMREPLSFTHIRSEGRARRMHQRLMAVVAEGVTGRIYLDPTDEMEEVARLASPNYRPDDELPHNPRNFNTPNYGLRTYADLFTDRQLVALTTFSDLVSETREKVKHDYLCARTSVPHSDDDNPLVAGGTGAQAYADSIATYLAFAVSRMSDYHCALATWNPTNENVSHLFQRQAIPMAWDFAEANPLDGKLDFSVASKWIADSLETVPAGRSPANVFQYDARSDNPPIDERVAVSTDPPYYDNIGYADLSDFFYVWLRRTLREIDPQLFQTVLTPKSAELIASTYRHDGSADAAEAHFRKGFAAAFGGLHRVADTTIPMTVYYAFKQSETAADGKGNGATASTGWETMLAGLINAGFAITGTWPVRTTKKARSVARNTNALASAIVIVCRERDSEAQSISRREFINILKRELPMAVKTLQRANIAPVDLAQAAIGPGMAVFSRYAQVLEADGAVMPVRQALIEINRVLDETLAEAESDMDADTRFCVAWFEQYGTTERAYGEAEVLFTAKNTSFAGLEKAGVIVGGGGKVRLKNRDELDPSLGSGNRQTYRRLGMRPASGSRYDGRDRRRRHGSRSPRRRHGAGSRVENARALAYRLYTVSERKGWTGEALAYNVLVTSWPQIQAEMARLTTGGPSQLDLEL